MPIYFIRSEKGGPIKIGIANNIERRLKELQTAHPYHLEIIGELEGNHDDEKYIHRLMRKHRLLGEWFKPHKDIFHLMEVGLETNRLELIQQGREKGWSLNRIGVSLGLSRQRVHQILAEQEAERT